MYVPRRRALPDSNQDHIALKEQVELLSAALKREKSAKQKLEAKLNDKLQENFDKNREFFTAFEQANSRQIQLQFLASITNELLSSNSIEGIYTHFISKISSLLGGCRVLLLKERPQSKFTLFEFQHNAGTLAQLNWHSEFVKQVSMFMYDDLPSNAWHRIEVTNNEHFQHILFEHTDLLIYKTTLASGQFNYVILDIAHFCYSDNLKQTLETARQQFSLGLNRHLTEIELAHNVSNLKNTVNELKSTQRQLVHSEKMASLGQLSAGVAHEINNPLGFIGSNIQVLQDYLVQFENTFKKVEQLPEGSKLLDRETNFARQDISALVDSCLNGVERISDIVKSLNSFSRKDNSEVEQVLLNEVIEDAIKIAWNELKYHYDINLQLSPELPCIEGNKGQLQQVFINLIINAAHAMKESGAGELTVKTELVDSQVIASVKDTGCGINDKALEQIFEPFFTTKGENEGTGLGLSVSYAIIEKHKGTIDVESAPNKGTTFTLSFSALQ